MVERWKAMVDFIIDRGSIENCMIVSSDDGSVFATSNDKTFYLREYSAVITQEDGSEKNETVNEANNLVKLMKGQTATQGLRINGTKKQQITRSFKDDETELQTIFSKFPMGGSCVANGGKCFLVATYNEVKGHTSPACNETITLMARYFAKSTWPTGNPSADSDSKQAPANWQSYVDMLLIGKGNIAQALICSAADGTVLAASDDFKVFLSVQHAARRYLSSHYVAPCHRLLVRSFRCTRRRFPRRTARTCCRPWTRPRTSCR